MRISPPVLAGAVSSTACLHRREEVWALPTLSPASGQSLEEESGRGGFGGLDSYSPGDVAESAGPSSSGALWPAGMWGWQ